MKVGALTFKKGQPVLYIDTAKTSTLEGASTTVYAQGGRGNARLIAWEGEKTLTFTVEDALISPIGMSILSAAKLFKNEKTHVHVHNTCSATVNSSGNIDLSDYFPKNSDGSYKECIDDTAPVFVMIQDNDGALTGELITGLTVDSTNKVTITGASAETYAGKNVFCDFYVQKSGKITEMQITADSFGGNFYVEAQTLFRNQADGMDMPAELIFPNVKIQSNFTFNMSATGDPSTFTFTMDALPGYTTFNKSKKVLCVMQVVEEADSTTENTDTVLGHGAAITIDEASNDSTALGGETTSRVTDA